MYSNGDTTVLYVRVHDDAADMILSTQREGKLQRHEINSLMEALITGLTTSICLNSRHMLPESPASVTRLRIT